MADTTVKYISFDNLSKYDAKLKTYIDSDKTKSIKAIAVQNNEINFFTNPTPTLETVPDFTVDFPVEYFLDQTKTTLEQEFVWSEEKYPDTINPSLDGKPVLVLGVKGDDNSISYSFLNLESLMNIYTGSTGTVIDIEIDPRTNTISGDLKLSLESGNILSIKEDGLYAEAILDVSGKADKITTENIKANQILIDDGTGNLAASKKTIEELKQEIINSFEAITEEEINGLFA